MSNTETFRVLVLGDFHYGESYPNGGSRVLRDRGYRHSTTNLEPFVEASDCTVLNLETPLVDPRAVQSPFAEEKSYVHWGHPRETADQMQRLGVAAVSLANNHTLDYGQEGLESTFENLSRAGIEWFGAGANLEASQAPFVLALPTRVGGGEIHFHGSFSYSKQYDSKYKFYAGKESPGCFPLRVPDVPYATDYQTREDTLQVAFPHWGQNYQWRNDRQFQQAHRFLKKNYDIIIGHGAHTMQEVHRKHGRWVVYGIGNGVFNSGGRWRRYERSNGILPFGFWTVLEVVLQDGQRSIRLKLYPVESNNRSTDFKPRPVSIDNFERIVDALSSRPLRPWRFDNSGRTTGVDRLGHFIALDVGFWALGERPSRLDGPRSETPDPAEWPLRSPSVEVEDQVLRVNKQMAASLFAINAEMAGGSTTWLTREIAMIQVGQKRMLTQGARAHESALGSTIVSDKLLTSRLLKESGVLTPATFSVDSAEDAVKAALSISGPVVVKPRYGRQSKGVSANLTEPNDIREAYEYAREYGSDILVQEYVDVAEELRIMASPERAYAVNRRVLPHVRGDGASNLEQLIADKNQQRELNPSLMGRPIPIDARTQKYLARTGRSLSDVPGWGELVTVRGEGGVSVGADIHQDLEGAEMAVRKIGPAAIAAIPGLEWGGADVIIEKESRVPYVIEINAKAGYESALFPTYGSPRNVSAEVWNLRLGATDEDRPSDVEVCETRRGRPSRVGVQTVNSTPVTFGRFLRQSLSAQGFVITDKGARVFEVASPGGESVWMTRIGLTSADRSVVRQVLRRHQLVCKLLDHANVARTPSWVGRTTRDISRFSEMDHGKCFVLSLSSPWQGFGANVKDAKDATSMVEKSPSRVWIQLAPEGYRLRVFATRERAVAIVREPGDGKIRAEATLSAGRIAVEAVRAVPELRWAAVDVLVSRTSWLNRRNPEVRVEGVTIEPTLNENMEVLAGDLDDFCRAIIGLPE